MSVTELRAWRYRRELAVLEVARRRVLQGDVRGIALCLKLSDNTEQISVLGDYRDHPVEGAAIAMRMSHRLNMLADELDETEANTP